MSFQSTFFQVAWVVDDIDVAMRNWIAEGIGPFFVIRDPNVEYIKYRGAPSDLKFSAAFAQSGHIQIELLCQNNDAPSYYRDAYAPGQSGFHHMNRVVADYDAEIAGYRARGIEIAGEGRSGGMRFAYIDTRETIQMMTEIIEESAGLQQFFKVIADASVGWDGSDPIREVTL